MIIIYKQNYEYKQLKLPDLLLDTNNPRFNPVDHQKEAIEAILNNQGAKLVELAKHIYNFSLNPAEQIIVQPFGKQWVVKEGNRRVTSLKLINEPDLIPNEYTGIKQEFKKLNKQFDEDLFEKIPCVIIYDEDALNEWIRLKHTGENKGAGLVNWDARQSARYNMQISKIDDPQVIFLDKILDMKNLPKIYKENSSRISQTNFNRLISDPDVRRILNISKNKGQYELMGGINDYILLILDDLIFNNLSVEKIYHKADRENYISEISNRVKSNHRKQPLTDNVDADEKNDRAHTHDTSDGKLKNDPIRDESHNGGSDLSSFNRKKLIPKNCKLNITKPRVLKIYKELKSLDCYKYPNAVAILFRVFVELSADTYIKNKSISVDIDASKLHLKINKIIEYMERNGIMSKNELRPIKQMSTSETKYTSIRTFNSYVHNIDITPSSTDLLSAWDDLYPFILKIWSD